MSPFRVILLLCVYIGLSACKEPLAEYEDPNLPYDRQRICTQLTDILHDYNGPGDHKNKPISRRELAKYYRDYKIYGCEK